MARIVVIEIKAVNTKTPYTFNPSDLILLGASQINLDSKSFKKSIIRQVVKDIGEDIIAIKDGANK